jgi:quercetin dioxygenase-like cupin family protein
MQSDNLKKLRALTPRLKEFIIQKPTNPGTNFIEYSPDNGGTFLGFGLFKEDAVAVQRTFMSKGTKVPEHNHKESEFVIVYRGSV